MISNILVTIASELSFLIGIIVGTFTSGLAALASTAMRGSGRLSVVRALLQGILTGLVAGAAGLGVSVMLGRSLHVSDRWLFWIAVTPPIIGEFGHFLRRLSLRRNGRPGTGLFAPLGLLHAAAWAPFRRFAYTLGLELFRENDPKEIPHLAVLKADWFVGWAISGSVIGVAVSMGWLSSALHVPIFR